MKKILNFPIKLILSFLILTEIFFFIGPINWNINNHVSLVIYFILINLSLFGGYKVGLKANFRTAIYSCSKRSISILILITFIIALYSILSDTGFSFEGLQKRVKLMMDLGDAYYTRNTEVNVIKYIIIQLLSPFSFLGLILGVYKWKYLSKRDKTIYIISIFLIFFYWVSSGVRKGVFDLLILLFLTYIISKPDIITYQKNRNKIFTLAFLSFALFLIFFLSSNLARYTQYDSFTEMLSETDINLKAFYVDVFPKWLIMPIVTIQSYLTQGYFALSKALEEGLIPPNIWATNMFTINIAERFYSNPLEGTYMAILEQKHGIDPYINWHSAYVWLANGFTLLGVPFIIFLIGFLLGNSLKRSLLYDDIIAKSLFVILGQCAFYFFANNQVFSFSFVSVTSFIVIYTLNIGNKCQCKKF